MQPEKLPAQVNARHQQGNVWISADERFLIVCTEGRSDGIGGWDYYVTFRDEDDLWSDLIHLGNVVNTGGDEYASSLSSDSKYFFFQSTSQRVL